MSRKTRKRGGQRRRLQAQKRATPQDRVLHKDSPVSRIAESQTAEQPLKKSINPETFRCAGKIEKVDEGLGLVFGWLMICKERNEAGDLVDYKDLHRNVIDEEGMVEALANFMINSRTTKAQHVGQPCGEAVFAFPMTEEIAKIYGFENVPSTGALFAARPDAESLEKFRDGTYTAFSIGGVHLEVPEPLEAS